MQDKAFFLDVLEIALAISLGLPATLLTLFFFHWLLSSRIQFSDDMRHVFSARHKRPYYSVRILKSGFFWLIDTTCVARLGIKDVRKVGSDTWTYYIIPTSFSNSLLYTKGVRYIHLKLHEVPELQRDAVTYLKSSTDLGRPDVGYRFEDILLSHKSVTLRVFIIGHDRFTGIKKLFRSHSYRLYNIRDGRWEGQKLIYSKQSKYA